MGQFFEHPYFEQRWFQLFSLLQLYPQQMIGLIWMELSLEPIVRDQVLLKGDKICSFSKRA